MSQIADKVIFWQQHIEQWKHSELTQKSYCHAQELSYAQFKYWSARLRAKASVNDVQLLPVQISTNIATQSNICLHLLSCRIELPVYTDTAYVRDLVQALSCSAQIR